MTKYWSECLPDMPANCNYSISSYGDVLKVNKKRILDACKHKCIKPNIHALFIAMAMLETTLMTSQQRDATKDLRTDGSMNVSLFNISIDMIKRLGYNEDILKLNDDNNIHIVLELLQKGINQWGIIKLLNYVRGGYTAFIDGCSYDVWNYRNTIATVIRVIDANPLLLTDDRRVDIFLKHV